MRASPDLTERGRRCLTPAPLRMERGVNSIVCKQRRRFFTSKRRLLHSKETPSSIGEDALLLLPLRIEKGVDSIVCIRSQYHKVGTDALVCPLSSPL
ncbi:hypothetical protein HMPREF0973_00809 [Prevotella veroralis F0319]|uniref:Uncharacterized protein n=1 Tax=Prevotella veroralis F0319 TaxID=649761 RepID=C9MMH9_9BACT|nr:hypothetical protein HMPREF0973_00809 [Prevotella veroralis F0319]